MRRQRERLELLHIRDSSIFQCQVVNVPRVQRVRQDVRQRLQALAICFLFNRTPQTTSTFAKARSPLEAIIASTMPVYVVSWTKQAALHGAFATRSAARKVGLCWSLEPWVMLPIPPSSSQACSQTERMSIKSGKWENFEERTTAS